MSHDALSPDQFTFIKATPKSMGGSPHHTVFAGELGNTRASLSWHHKTGEILDINVDPDIRREGVATAMYKHAQGLGVVKPRHSSDRTDAGDAWAKSTGNRVPPRKQRGPDPEYYVPESVRRSEQ